MKYRELKNALKMEAVELLSLPPDEIEFDYHMLRSKDKARGIFVAVPKRILDEYMAFLNRAKLIPIKISAKILGSLNWFLHEHYDNIKDKNFCILDCSNKNTVNLAIFNKANLELLRGINCIGVEDAKQEITQSLRYYLSKDAARKLDEIYFSGQLSNVGDLLETLERDFNLKVHRNGLAETGTCAALPKEAFKINLIKRHAVSLPARKFILQALNIFIVLCCLAGLVLWFQALKINSKIKETRSSFSPLDYSYAKGLETKKEMLKNEK
jgi:hypothetical protein